jgi:glycosyltransferase involved in cell wall biosynthesis
MKISATIICKNEASHIKECLESLTEVDEVVLCDTGSTDDTIAIAQQTRPEGLVVVHRRWNDNFADARNAALSAATGDWCLIVDCDETILPGTVNRLREAIAANPQVKTLRFLCQAKGDPTKIHAMVRAHARVPEVRWCGRIHEALTDDSCVVAPGCVLEYGYSEAHSSDPDRALRLLLLDYNEKKSGSKSDPRTLYYLSREYLYRKNYSAAIPLLKKRVANMGYRPECADAWLYLARCYWQTNQGDLAREACLHSLLMVPDCKETLLLMAEMSFPEQAAAWQNFASVAQNRGVLFIRNP